MYIAQLPYDLQRELGVLQAFGLFDQDNVVHYWADTKEVLLQDITELDLTELLGDLS